MDSDHEGEERGVEKKPSKSRVRKEEVDVVFTGGDGFAKVDQFSLYTVLAGTRPDALP